jgi:WD40 repeat protein
MTDKKPCVSSLVVAVLVVALLCGCQPASLAGGSAIGTGEKTLKLVTEYKNNVLEDISTDGRLLLFYQTSKPMRTYTIPIDGSRGKANQPEVSGDTLRVVERESGREVGSVKVAFFPESVQFIPGTQQIFYTEPTSNKQGRVFRVWNFSTGEAKTCDDTDAVSFRHATVIDAQHALGAVLQENGGELLGKLTLPGCTRAAMESVNPSNPNSMTWGGLNLSHNKRFLAYGTNDEVIIRDAATLNTLKRIKPPSGLIFGGNPIYTPDGKFLLVVASNTIFDKPETKRYLLFYDTTSYEVARRLDITSWNPPVLRNDVAVNSNAIGTAMAISPNSRFLAVGYTKEERKALTTTDQAQVVLYDLTTSEEVAKASHPQVKKQRNDPFAAKIGKLAFTPDAKYLLSSAYDTLIWEIVSKAGDR